MSDEIRDDESSLFEVPTSEPAEGVPGTEVADGDMNEIPKGPNHTRRNRVVVGCVAAVLVAGLGIGLALSHGAPAQEAPVAATTAAATPTSRRYFPTSHSTARTSRSRATS